MEGQRSNETSIPNSAYYWGTYDKLRQIHSSLLAVLAQKGGGTAAQEWVMSPHLRPNQKWPCCRWLESTKGGLTHYQNFPYCLLFESLIWGSNLCLPWLSHLKKTFVNAFQIKLSIWRSPIPDLWVPKQPESWQVLREWNWESPKGEERRRS